MIVIEEILNPILKSSKFLHLVDNPIQFERIPNFDLFGGVKSMDICFDAYLVFNDNVNNVDIENIFYELLSRTKSTVDLIYFEDEQPMEVVNKSKSFMAIGQVNLNYKKTIFI